MSLGRRFPPHLPANQFAAKAAAETSIWLDQRAALPGEPVLNRQTRDVPLRDQDLAEKLTGPILLDERAHELLLRDQAHLDQEQTQ